MKSFQIAQFGAPLVEADAATPQPVGSQVLLKVLGAGMCHSDLHIWEGSYEMGHGRQRLSFSERGMKLPVTLGHETAGEVVAIGPDVTDVKVGDARLVYPWIGCGTCSVCRAGDEHMCSKPAYIGVQQPGGYADHVMVPHARYLLDLSGLDPVDAAPYACSGITAYGAVKKVRDAFDSPILIIGAGGLGLMALSLLKAMGGRGAIVMDVDACKRDAAIRAGAIAAIDASAQNALEQVLAIAGGPVRAAIDFVGNPETATLGFDSLAKGGKLVMVGLFGGGAPWPLPFIPIKAITIQGSYVGSLRETRELLDLVREKQLRPIPVTRFRLAGVNEALANLQNGKLVGRGVLVP
ncbi:alcohol dehydrogenase [Burkholderia sp. Ac-20353]|uniref:alcohol dehydrogenase n=1 Tax=Burkholderia sp. Ac-20353 TaxID=2703894 RepID=UPI00197BB15C|nr:alcohol dehydrogenase [Burkholderia sp. Ac-20353]MBN3785961.1 alcohol dehydrogenase catalytic domain-containing protein [Burkholderia sp. Ac-20353]